MSEPIRHLAKRALKNPESLRASEIKRMAEWVVAAYAQKMDELNAGQIEESHVLGARILIEKRTTLNDVS